ncbi:PBP1A family penicillin-binding protein [Virgibacillus sp. 179-BFC.A HS]|uniref:PBP1A family penicillin-binding protein n=1 Tax=Tigheibacillus jepli TaxID=3035914 RepID=A0ABU5CJK6_9BACI|nr:PBP1A family penicillin-binding protein [Virgibacillus sp. 179-BFC.A HS]MDY0406543.1 PBP1A family penicillin-binding protein [Virgibacillus sp. 179-BFC.A HS]
MWKKILLSMFAVVMLVIVALCIMVAVMIFRAPSLNASDLQTPLSTRIYDQDKKLIGTLFHQENRVKVSIDEVPKVVQDAVISIEDKRFRSHHGVDVHRLAGAIIGNIKNGWGTEGASTITQQVIKRSVLTPEKTLTRKVQEAWLSLQLERKYSKDEILEMYLNNVYFGHGAYGIKTASITYFGQEDLSKLSVSQAALLAGLPNLPSADDPFKYPERAKERRDLVLSAMANNNVISKQQADQAKEIPISKILRKEEKKQEKDSPYNAYIDTVYEQLVKKEKIVTEKEFYQDGLKIYTYLDSKAQRKVYKMLHSKEIPYPDKNFEAGISLVDTKTGAVKAVGGGRHFKSISYTNYGSSVKNQPGSTIKPVLDYGPAIEYLKWPTSYTLNDEHYQYSDGTPINEWDNEYWGNISMRRALEWSRNIPALKAFQAVGSEKAQKFAGGLGIKIDPIYESASIGGFDGVTPLQMAAAYAAFGNGGTYNEPNTVKKIVFPDGKEWKPKPKSRTAMHDYTAYMITDMLKTVVASGTGTQANLDGIPVAGKTGSTNIPKELKDQYGLGNGIIDSWFSGYTTQYAMAVWTGYPSLKNKDGDIQYIRYDGSQDIAKQLFRQIMIEISDPNTPDFEKPDSVATIGSELYVKGTQPQTVPEKQTEPDSSKQVQEEQKDQEAEETDEEEKDNEDEENQDTSKQDQVEQNEKQQEDEKTEKEQDKKNEEQPDQDDKKQDNQNGKDQDQSKDEDHGQENQGPDDQKNKKAPGNNDNNGNNGNNDNGQQNEGEG